MPYEKENRAELTVISAPLRDVMSDIARLHRKHRTFGATFARAGRVIVLKVGKQTAYVVARGPAGVKADEISLDSATREKLQLSAGQKANFVIKQANLVDEFRWAWGATDAMPRVGARLGAVSVVLGVVGFVLGIISICA